MALLRAWMCALLLVAASYAAAQVNPAARPARDATPLAGTWNGAHLEQRSSCATAGNNGFHGTYAEYIVRVEPSRGTIGLDEMAITGLTCNFFGPYREEDGRILWSGNHTCNDGRRGTFEAQNVFALTTLMQLRLSIHLTSSEGCTIDAMMSGARF